MIKLFISLLMLMMFAPSPAEATSYYAEGGAYFGQQGCSSKVSIPRSIKRIEDDQAEIAKEIKELERTIRKLEDDADDAEKKFNQADEGIRNWLEDASNKNIVGAVTTYLSSNSESQRKMLPNPNTDCEGGEIKAGADYLKPWDSFCTNINDSPNEFNDASKNWSPTSGGTQKVFTQDGTMNPEICKQKEYVKSANHERLTLYTGQQFSYATAMEKCENGIKTYAQAKGERLEAQAALEIAEARLAELEDMEDDLLDDKDYELSRWEEDMEEGRTSATYCYSCNHGSESAPSTFDKILGIAAPLAGAYLGYRAADSLTGKITKANQQLGWPTDSGMIGFGVGYPLVMAGLYGGALIGGNNAFGCSGGMGGNYGAFGYPGMGYPGMGFPGMGGAMMAGMGGMMMPGMMIGGMGGMMYGGMPGMMYGGMPGMMYGGMPGMMYGGMPGMMMPMAGGMPGMMIGGIGSMITGGMMPMAGGMMMPMAGGMMGAMMPMSGGMMMPMAGGMMGAMMPMAGGMMMPMAGGMMGAMMPMSGGMMMPMAGGSMANLQYQQQLMQMQQQQMQQWMAEQQRMQQDYAQRSQLVGRLSEELYRIQMQIQQISTGAYGGSSYGSGGYGYGSGGGAYPTGNAYDPNLGGGTGGGYNGPARGQGYRIPGQ